MLVFKVKTKLGPGEFLTVRRAESDFYSLRTILSLSFGQCFIPPLTPINKEATFSPKSIQQRERTFSRFLKGVVRSPDLCSHPLVLEFLKIDHHRVDRKNGLRDFSKRLAKQEQDLLKISGTYFNRAYMKNEIYRVASFDSSISIDDQFSNFVGKIDLR